ncbi:MAG: hypothetical protein IRZ28_21010 [Steroidobacteraceae bacterium]|nr:hypothetical protein [Steroidobacteraceae bacterium]
MSRSRPATLVLLVVTALLSYQGFAVESEWLDMEGRIEYAFYTEDARALRDIAAQLARNEATQEPLSAYYAGLANYRLALVLASRDKEHAKDAIERCIDRLSGSLKAQPDFAPALALQSACLRTASILSPWNPLAGTRSAGQMARASKLAPRDPRVLLLQALEKGESGPIDDEALAKLQEAAAAFEAERHAVEHAPRWGAAEAYAHLGRGYLERGDVLAARDALERALLIAPDFALARRLLMEITSG